MPTGPAGVNPQNPAECLPPGAARQLHLARLWAGDTRMIDDC
jgi:hypothetical protein